MVFWMADSAFLRVTLNPNARLFFSLKWHISDTISDLSGTLFKILIYNGLMSCLTQILKKNKELKPQIIRKKFKPWKQPCFLRFVLALGFWSVNSNIRKGFCYYYTVKWKKNIFEIWHTLAANFCGSSRIVFLKMKIFKSSFVQDIP